MEQLGLHCSSNKKGRIGNSNGVKICAPQLVVGIFSQGKTECISKFCTASTPMKNIFATLCAETMCLAPNWLKIVELSQSLLMVDIGLPPDLANPAWLGLAKVQNRK